MQTGAHNLFVSLAEPELHLSNASLLSRLDVIVPLGDAVDDLSDCPENDRCSRGGELLHLRTLPRMPMETEVPVAPLAVMRRVFRADGQASLSKLKFKHDPSPDPILRRGAIAAAESREPATRIPIIYG
ncbi:hypothetical protein [Methylobacterium sp. 77]|uniref:hypothetical protein n=1 Tax=Methylobacterium sp. 77 TaxID=1101192 RepID=UPI0012DEA707|nr:hypothetical protein [Methylobacterium sp. 77]